MTSRQIAGAESSGTLSWWDLLSQYLLPSGLERACASRDGIELQLQELWAAEQHTHPLL
jgi:hypothetical protein